MAGEQGQVRSADARRSARTQQAIAGGLPGLVGLEAELEVRGPRRGDLDLERTVVERVAEGLLDEDGVAPGSELARLEVPGLLVDERVACVVVQPEIGRAIRGQGRVLEAQA